jgi:hypothetical protein
MQSNISLLQIFVSAIIGGTVTAVLYPIAKYFFVRWINTRKVKIKLRPADESPINEHISHPLRITNKGISTIKSATCFIFIEYLPEDLVPPNQEPNIQAYRSNSSYQWLSLSWARVIDDKIRSVTELNVGDEADLNVFRFHKRAEARPLLQIASEQGFHKSGSGRTGRVLLFADKDYLFKIKVTGDNIFPITKSFRFTYKVCSIQDF